MDPLTPVDGAGRRGRARWQLLDNSSSRGVAGDHEDDDEATVALTGGSSREGKRRWERRRSEQGGWLGAGG